MTVIDESLTAKGFTPAYLVPAVFGRKRTIDAITIHWWGLPGQTHDGVNNFFVYGVAQTSAHFVASGTPTKRINCLVSPADAAWACGNAVGNATTVSIEMRPEGSDADYEVGAELIRFLRDTYGANLPLIPHRHWQATQCPGNYNLTRLHNMAEALKGTTPIPNVPKVVTPVADLTVSEWREGAGVILNTNIQEYDVDGETPKGIKTAARILGLINPWMTRVLVNQARIEQKLDTLLEQHTPPSE